MEKEFKVPSGDYETEVISSKILENGDIDVHLLVHPIGDKDQQKYYVFYSPNRIYTAIGADNRHHAANKATKLWKGLWTSISIKPPESTFYKYLPLTEFGKWIKEAIKREEKEEPSK